MITFADETAAIMLGQAGSASTELFRARSNTQYVEPGFLLFAQDGGLIARRFDAATGQISGGLISVASPVRNFLPTGLAQFSASRTGVIAYQAQTNLSRIAWFDRSGKDIGVVREPADYLSLRLSPDGRRLLYDQTDARTGAHNVHLLEIDRGAQTQLTSEIAAEVYPLWLTDDTMIYMSTRWQPPRLVRRSQQSGVEEPLGPEATGLQQPTDISKDRQWLLYSQRPVRGDFDIHVMHLADRKVVALRESDFNETDARFSPDGRHVAFVSTDGGRPNVYITPFPSTGARRAVTSDGAGLPRWSPDGRELFYIAASATEAHVMSVPVMRTPDLDFGKATRLFPLPPGRWWSDYAPTADGRFLAMQQVQFAGTQPVTVIANWTPPVR